MKRIGRRMYDVDGRDLGEWYWWDTAFLAVGKALERLGLWLFRPR